MAEARVVTPEGASLQCEVRGRGTPLLMIHGWPLDQRVFKPQFADLSRRYRTISFDRRGCGKSGGFPNLSLELDDIDAVLDATCGDAPVHVLAMSEGVRVAMRYLVSRPGRVRSLALQGPVLDGYQPEQRPDEQVPLEEFAALARDGKLAEVRRRWLKHPVMSYGVHGSAASLLEEILADYEGRDLHMEPEDPEPEDVQVSLRDVKVPVLLLSGTGDSLACRQTASRILELIPLADEVKLPGCGHLCNLGDPALYNRMALAFFDTH